MAESFSRRALRFVRTRLESPFVQLAFLSLLGAVAIGFGGNLAAGEAGESEAMAEVRSLTELVAHTVVEPSLEAGLLDSEGDAIAELDGRIREFVLTGTTVRVKLWTADGRIVYSDEPRLIGEVYQLEDDQFESLWSGEVVSEISTLSGPENRFEAEFGTLLEVYLPITGPDGAPLLYESYFAMSAVDDSNSRIRSAFAPIIIGSLVLMFALHIMLAWALNRRLRRGQIEKERLLQRAIEASDLERRRIASDLHDGVVQDLVATSFAIANAADTATVEAPELATDLRSATVGARRSLQSLRSLLVDIYPPNLKTQGLAAALGDLLAPVTSLGIETELDLAGEDALSERNTELIYRVSREATRNVLRHADASTLTISVEVDNQSAVASIVDDGRGFRPSDATSEGQHLGLRVLSDLAADADASLSISSQPGDGTTIRLEVPT